MLLPQASVPQIILYTITRYLLTQIRFFFLKCFARTFHRCPLLLRPLDPSVVWSCRISNHEESCFPFHGLSSFLSTVQFCSLALCLMSWCPCSHPELCWLSGLLTFPFSASSFVFLVPWAALTRYQQVWWKFRGKEGSLFLEVNVRGWWMGPAPEGPGTLTPRHV